jgi:hypothetical protein
VYSTPLLDAASDQSPPKVPDILNCAFKFVPIAEISSYINAPKMAQR